MYDNNEGEVMKRNVIIGLLLIIIGIVGIILIRGGQSDSVIFKKDYESVNGKENSHGKINRVVSIPEDNPFVITDANDIVQRIENKETFYVYFGSKLCPWCRSTIEKAIMMAKERGIAKIYYVDIWDDEGNEIVRDKYVLDDNNKATLEKAGISAYSKLLTYFDALLRDYTLTDASGNVIEVGEKRIYAPNYVYVEKGVIKKLVTGISDKQTDSRGELTPEILADEEEIFSDFFTEVCLDAC